MHLLIDDIRDVGCDLIARTPEIGFMCLHQFKGVIKCAYFDNDLGEGVEEGYSLMQRAFQVGIMPKQVQLVTSNPVAKRNMAFLLEAHGYTRALNGIDFFKKA